MRPLVAATPTTASEVPRNRRREKSGISATAGSGSLPSWSRRRRTTSPTPDRDDGRKQRHDRLHQRIQQDRYGQGGDSRAGESKGGQAEPMARHDAKHRRAADGHGHDQQVEDELVVGSEQVDHELLGARWLEGDDRGADLDHERWRARDEPGQELIDADGGRAGRRAGKGGISLATWLDRSSPGQSSAQVVTTRVSTA